MPTLIRVKQVRNRFIYPGETEGCVQWRIQDLAKGGHGERAEREPITGVWGGAPSGVQGQSPWSGGQGAKPP